MKTLRANEIVFDFSVYPRFKIDQDYVAQLLVSLIHGSKFPPIIIERKSKRLVDGGHRLSMYLTRNPGQLIEVIEKDYKNDAELFADAIKYNANHGRNLDRNDREKCFENGKKVGLSVSSIAKFLYMTMPAPGAMTTESPGELSVNKNASRKPKPINAPRVYPQNTPSSEKVSYPSTMNRARAEQVMADINQSFNLIEGEFDRLNILISEAEAGKYWKLQFKSIEDWKKSSLFEIVELWRD